MNEESPRHDQNGSSEARAARSRESETPLSTRGGGEACRATGAHTGEQKPLRIGLFDSGAGGLSVLRQLAGCLTQDASFVYVADTARCPYGNRTPAEIGIFAEQTAHWLVESAVDRLVMACNTSAAIAGSIVRHRTPLPVHDLIRPVSIHCARYRRVAVFATSATCRSGAFSRAMAAVSPDVSVLEVPCPELVPLVEGGHFNDAPAMDAVRRCIENLGDPSAFDAVVLGCTHFPFMREAFRAQLPSSVVLVDPAEYLRLELFHESPSAQFDAGVDNIYKRCAFFTTGDPDAFARIAESCLLLDPGSLEYQVCGISTSDFVTVIPTMEYPGLDNTLAPVVHSGAAEIRS